jgi:hypothetical protein
LFNDNLPRYFEPKENSSEKDLQDIILFFIECRAIFENKKCEVKMDIEEVQIVSWGKHTYTLLDRINEIEKAMECGFWQSALAMALTIPDICGQIEFTNMVRWDKKHEKYFRLVGEQYKAWYSKYVEHYYADKNT